MKLIQPLSGLAAIVLLSVAVVAEDMHDHDHDQKKPATMPAPAKHEHDHDDHDKPAAKPAAKDEHDHDEKGHSDEVHLTPEAIRRHGIKVEKVRRDVLATTFTAPARVAFNTDAMAHVGSALKGRVVEIKAKLGDSVKKGDELLVIESTELAEAQSDFLLKRAEVEVAEASVEPAKQAFDRANSLAQNEGIAKAEVQKRQAEWKSAQARLTAANAVVTAGRNKLLIFGMDQPSIDALAKSAEVNPRYAVRATIAGQVVERDVVLGELVDPEHEALMVLADLSTLWVIADVAEGRLTAVSVGSPARVQLAANGHQAITGKVVSIASSLDAETRAASVRIEVPQNDALRPGMFARAEISALAKEGAEKTLMVPEESIQTYEGGPVVFVPVEGEENTFAAKPVKVGKTVAGMVPILGGVEEGQPIVTAGTFILKADLGKSGAAHQH